MKTKTFLYRWEFTAIMAICLMLTITCILMWFLRPSAIQTVEVIVYKESAPQIITEVVTEVVVETVTETVYVPEFRQWESSRELKDWLEQNAISDRKYLIDIYDCDDFAMDLVLAAAQDGYYIGISAYPIKDKWHMACFAVIGNDIYKINPQNDYQAKWLVLD